LLGFGGGFGVFDAFLEFLLKGLLEKLSSFDEEEVFHVVECLTEGGGFGDEIALVEQGIKFRVEKFSGGKMGRLRLHKVRPCKNSPENIVPKYHQTFMHPWKDFFCPRAGGVSPPVTLVLTNLPLRSTSPE
jgi:hypothetical protein